MGFMLASVLLLAGLASANAEGLQMVDYSSASVNDWADRMLYYLRPQLIAHNVDPLKIGAINLPFTINFLGEHQGELNMTDGYAVGVSTLERIGDCVINYDLKILRIDLELIVNELLLDFKYDLSVLGFSPSGNLNAHITSQRITVSILIDVKLGTFSLQSLELPNDGKLRVSIDGLGILGDALAGVVLAVVERLFKDTVIGTVGNIISSALNDWFGSFNPLPTIPPSTVPPMLQHILGF